jgi:hypothetical protein
MVTGTVNTFAINGTALNIQPTKHNWIKKSSVGTDGGGHAIYPALAQYQMQWDYMSAAEFSQLLTFYDSFGTTGTVVASLPKYKNSTYTFFDYSGCVIDAPGFDNFFENYYENVVILISSIRT